MRRAWPPVYRPPPQQQPRSKSTSTRYRRETVAAAGACFVIAAPCSCSPDGGGPLTARNQQQRTAAATAPHNYRPPSHHRGLPPPLPARNGGGGGTGGCAGGCSGCGYRYGCCAPDRQQKPLSCQVPEVRKSQQQRYHTQLQQQQQHRRCAYVRPRPSRSLENLLRVVELDETAPGHRGVYEKSCHYSHARRKMKVPGKENRHAWKRRSMESLLSARDAAAVAAKNFEYFRHVRTGTASPVSVFFYTFCMCGWVVQRNRPFFTGSFCMFTFCNIRNISRANAVMDQLDRNPLFRVTTVFFWNYTRRQYDERKMSKTNAMLVFECC